MKITEKRFCTLLLTLVLVSAGYSVLNGEDASRGPLFAWETVVVSPIANISIEGGSYTDSDAEELVERFRGFLKARGISSRVAMPTDKRFIEISMQVMIGPDSPFLLRLQQKESVRYLRNGQEVEGVASTWEFETRSNYDGTLSTPWPKIEEAMKLLIDDLEAAIRGDTITTAEQAQALNP